MTLQWDRRSGVDGQVQRVNVVSAEALAVFLGVRPHWKGCEDARRILQPWQDRPQVRALLSEWAARRSPRERKPEDAPAFADAMKVVDHLSHSRTDDSIRRLSATLFDNSKRIEELAVELDLLTREEEGPAREKASLFAELGLLSYALPFHLAARQARVMFSTQSAQSVVAPYSAFDPDSISGIEFDGRYVLSVENYTIFHELSRNKAGAIDGLLLYTGGMPSPAWRRAYQRIIVAAPGALLHWGDTDVGGVRALAKLQEAAAAVGRNVLPWRMGEGGAARKPLTDSDVNYLKGLCSRHGWSVLEESIWAAAGFTDTEFRCDDESGGGLWRAGHSAESTSLRR